MDIEYLDRVLDSFATRLEELVIRLEVALQPATPDLIETARAKIIKLEAQIALGEARGEGFEYYVEHKRDCITGEQARIASLEAAKEKSGD